MKSSSSRFDANYFNKKLKSKTLIGKIYDKILLTLDGKNSKKQLGLLPKALSGRMLEVGSGLSSLCNLAQRKFQTFSLDIADLDVQKNLPNFVRASAEAIPYRGRTFSVVVAIDVIEHLTNPLSFLKCAADSLVPGGYLIIRTPNTKSIGNKLMKSEWYAFTDDTHISLHDADFWTNELRKSGFVIEDVFTDTFLLYSPKIFEEHPSPKGLILLGLTMISRILSASEVYFSTAGENTCILARSEGFQKGVQIL